MKSRKGLLVGFLFLMIAMVSGWGLFGSRSEQNSTLGSAEMHRFLGRVTRVVVDSDRDGQPDGHYTYSWYEPYGEPGARPQRYREDRNLDGVWDTWATDLGWNDDGERELRFEVDLDGDGAPDWTFKSLDSLSGDEAIVERRGY